MTAPTPTYNLAPRTRFIRASDVKPGHIVIESYEHPAVVVEVVPLNHGRTVRLMCRSVWSATDEDTWPMGPFHPDARIEISKEK